MNDFLDSEEFYNLMQVYRWNRNGTGSEEFEAVKKYIRDELDAIRTEDDRNAERHYMRFIA